MEQEPTCTVHAFVHLTVSSLNYSKGLQGVQVLTKQAYGNNIITGMGPRHATVLRNPDRFSSKLLKNFRKGSSGS